VPEVIVHLETIAVHAAAEPDGVTRSVAPPIHLSTTFEHGPASEHIHGYSYIREANPTQTRLETALAQLEGGEAALAFASGMGAGSAVLQTLAPGSHVIMPDDVYVDFRNLAKELFFMWQLEHTVVDTSQIEGACRPANEHTVNLAGDAVESAHESYGHRRRSGTCTRNSRQGAGR
jgi:cystathionine gamma-synthase